jgi:hypothetical protein
MAKRLETERVEENATKTREASSPSQARKILHGALYRDEISTCLC